jgi:peptidoglycan/LPS O-acetylase OafA/YrhL
VQLDVAFDTRPNAFNAVRLALASSVIVWHAVLFTEDVEAAGPVWQGLDHFAVDGFFVVSGFLIVRSWERRPVAAAFIRARLGRLLPGLWVCLVVTAFVIAPLAGGTVTLVEQLRYVIDNAGVFVTEPSVGAPLTATNGWNLSLWSLFWELLCYSAVLTLGLLRALRASVLKGAALLFWAWMTVITMTGQWLHLPNEVWMVAIPRLGLMFTLGSLAYLHRDRVPVSGWLAATAVGALALSIFTPNYHLFGAPALAYLVLWAGIELGRFPWLRMQTDLSYGMYLYGAPVMVALLLGDVLDHWWSLTGATVALVVPLAAASWFLVEQPVLLRVRGNSAGGAGSGRLVGRVLRARTLSPVARQGPSEIRLGCPTRLSWSPPPHDI